jgi:transcriptional regulator with XRE-family HTH domain
MEKHVVDEHVGSKLRQFRLLADVTQKELGDALGVSFQQVQKYEVGSNRVSASKLYEIAKFLDVPVSAFFPKDAESASFGSIDPDEAAIIRAYRSAPDNVKRAMRSLTESFEDA